MKKIMKEGEDKQGESFPGKMLSTLRLLLSHELYEEIAEEWEKKEEEERQQTTPRPAH